MHLKKLNRYAGCFLSRKFSPGFQHQACHTGVKREIPSDETSSRMSAWQVTSYSNNDNVVFSTSTDVPVMYDTNQVLVKVAAASVNPLDIEMLRGFGHVLLRSMRQVDSLCKSHQLPELPLILGRDFAGVVVAKGSSVTSVDIGDEVYGVVNPQYPGCHAEYTITSDSLVSKKPEFLSVEKASAILYTSLTAWSALKISGGFIVTSPLNKRVLVLGSSGGVGQTAVQMLHAWGAQAVATCRTDAIPHVEKLAPESIIDYTSPNYMEQVKAAGPYDIVLDAAGLPEAELLKFSDVIKSCGSLVTLRSPLLSNIDEYGLVVGSIKSAVDLAVPNILSGVLKKGSFIKWAFVMPCATAVQEISSLVNEGKINPEIEKVYSFSQVPDAYEKMKAGHLRGKIVIDVHKKEEGAPDTKVA